MQGNVNAICARDYAIETWGRDNVTVLPDGIIRCFVRAMGSGDITTVSNILRWADVHVKRSDKGLVILFNPKPDSNPFDKSHFDEAI